ncbi:MAG: ABC transporter substrate-binding protein [Nitrospirales bacterium]|nr:ABC transporter substrate-binding protein [Nitrospira sp.]MDR4459714.1 ABC transporter substrate-binding protein [Nitrospirales bacterium]
MRNGTGEPQGFLFENSLRNVAVIFLGWVVVFLACLTAAWGGSTPTGAVKETVDQVFVVLRDQSLKDPARQTERRAKLEEIIGQRFDYAEMAKRTLASQWKGLSSEQQQEFVILFQQFLANSYVGNVDGYSGEEVEYLKEREKGEFAEVQTKVVSPKVQIPLDYRLLQKNGEWWVYDVVIDGVSLMKNYRGQFSRIINSSSFEALLEKLRSKADLGTSS